jgi:EAL domain-containing protein (putative c-di-GMP-specific phosphodiesterase class I)
LFLNVHGRLLAAVRENHGHTFRDALERIGLLPGNIVIETPESANQDRTLLALVLANYRINGFRVAANALDVEDLESVLRVVRPDFVKIDARRLRSDKEATRTYQIARDNGARPVFIRVESAIQRQLLQSLPDTLLQGNAIAKAKALPVDGPVLPPADDYRDHAAAA